MGLFNKPSVATALRSPVVTPRHPDARTMQGGTGYSRGLKGELFLLAVSNMVSQNTFYENGGQRDDRYEKLIREVAVADPAWTAQFLSWLRHTANMRSASLAGAMEAARAMIDAAIPGSRQLIAGVLARGDEPAEAVAYWLSRYGRTIPKAVKRGIAEAVWRLYTQRGLIKYDSAGDAIRFGDVIDLVHPTGSLADTAGRFPIKGTWRGDLYKYALDRRHSRDNPVPESLTMIAEHRRMLAAIAAGDLSGLLDPAQIAAAGMTWEAAKSAAGKNVDEQRLWEALIPNMGFMARLRNLRNFDQAGISDEVAAQIAAQLADPAEVAGSRQFPFRFLSAYRAVGNLRWAYPLEKALTLSLSNVPALPGRTLVLVDQSPSMFPGAYYTNRNKEDKMGICLADQAKIFGTAVALRAGAADLIQYGGTSEVVPFSTGDSLLKLLDKFHVISSTDTAGAASRWFRPGLHDRVVIVTDEQTVGNLARVIPAEVPVYTWNLGGYQTGHGPSGSGLWHTFGGLTDAAFQLIPLLEGQRNASWPWEIPASAG